MKDKYGTSYQIPEPMNIHRFLEGLKNDSIKQKLYTEELTTWEDYFYRASLLEQSKSICRYKEIRFTKSL